MSRSLLVSRAGRERSLTDLPASAFGEAMLDELVPPRAAGPENGAAGGGGPWEVEIGFGKGRYLLGRALAEPERRFLGVEVASKYYRLLAGRAARQGADNLVACRGEATFAMASVLPRRFAEAVHVYHPDPWPKAKHHKRRLFDPETLDLVLGLLAPGGRLVFGTDFLEYGELVVSILRGYPGLQVEVLEGGWPGGPRTNYEAKYVAEGRPILRLVAHLTEAPVPPPLHPEGRAGVLTAFPPPKPEED